jgi:putative DNA primase/helicase
VCSCPCHDDTRASLSLTERDGKLLFKCHANCDQRVLVAEFKRRGWLNGADPDKQKSTIVATFPYVDEAGDLLYEVVRYESKAHKQRRPDGNGGWIWKLGGRVLYRLPELLEDLAAERTIFIVEAERKVDLLRRWNIAATCNSGGAEKWRPVFSECFGGAEVVLLPDNDVPGRKHVDKVAASLIGADARVRVLALPGLGPKGDIVDWAAVGGTAEQLLALVEQTARPWSNGETKPFAAGAPDDQPPNIGEDQPPQDGVSEDELALAFAAQHTSDVRYTDGWSKWHQWNVKCWGYENTLAAFDLARKLIRRG